MISLLLQISLLLSMLLMLLLLQVALLSLQVEMLMLLLLLVLDMWRCFVMFNAFASVGDHITPTDKMLLLLLQVGLLLQIFLHY
jgi:hypothetical protein